MREEERKREREKDRQRENEREREIEGGETRGTERAEGARCELEECTRGLGGKKRDKGTPTCDESLRISGQHRESLCITACGGAWCCVWARQTNRHRPQSPSLHRSPSPAALSSQDQAPVSIKVQAGCFSGSGTVETRKKTDEDTET